MVFGKNGCSSISVTPLAPICSHPDIEGTSPLVLDVPVPSFVHPTPPAECVCFDFTSKQSGTVVITDCARQGDAKVSVAITPATGDCCAGSYVVTPSVEIPCMPFSVKTPTVVVKNRSNIASRGIDGGATFSLAKSCCSLDSEIHITLPDCKKGYDPALIPSTQITYCSRDSSNPTVAKTVTHKLIEMVVDDESCSLYPSVNPITLPCCSLPDKTLGSGSFKIDHRGSTVSWSLRREDCDVKMGISSNIVDCACFSFSSAEVTPVATCVSSPKCKVSITKQAGTDCCDGKFDVTPSIQVPCIPFTIKESSVSVNTGSTGTGTGASLSFSLNNNCCELQPVISLSLPPCQTTAPVMPSGAQVSYLNKGNSQSANFISFAFNPNDCAYTPTVTYLDLPCPVADVSASDWTEVSLGSGGKIGYKFNVTDCVPSLEITSLAAVNPGGVPCIPTIANDNFTITLKYKTDPAQTTQTVKTGTFSITKNVSGGCGYSVGNATIDLETIKPSVGSGGDVFMDKAGNLHIDGDTTTETTWFGGGIGDAFEGTGYSPENVERRGPKMGANYGNGSSNNLVVVHQKNTYLIDENKTQRQYWASARRDSTTGERGYPSTLYESQCASGNLDMIVPVGVQWHRRGHALTLLHTVHNSSGVLSRVNELSYMAVFAPGLAVVNDAYKDGDSSNNGSGLCVVPADGTSYVTKGLSVKPGYGLHIYNIGDETTPTSDKYRASDRQGGLEVLFGSGLRAVQNKNAGNEDVDTTGSAKSDAKYTAVQSEANGAISIYPRDKDLAFDSKGALALNDKEETQSSVSLYDEVEEDMGVLPRKRGNSYEYSIPIIVPNPGYLQAEGLLFQNKTEKGVTMQWGVPASELDALDPDTYMAYIDEFFNTCCIMYLHISSSGVVLGIDHNSNGSSITRTVKSAAS